MNRIRLPSLPTTRCILLAVLVFAFGISSPAQTFPGGKSLDPKLYHLGDDIIDLWPDISHKPDGERLDIKFTSQRNDKNFTLTLTYWDVNYPAAVVVNGKEINQLPPSQKSKDATVIIPAGSLVDGENTLSILPQLKDDCVIGKVVLHEKPFRELMKLQTVVLSVLDQGSKTLIPARLTITDSKGAPKEIFSSTNNQIAVRKGLIYLPAAETRIDLVEGEYVIEAARGFEWSLDRQTVSIRGDKKLQFKLRREVDTKGFVAVDTHLHTLTFSGHGDATAEERIVTIAGEGVELAIATDHHHQTDYKPFQEKLGMNRHFTSVTGNEVSTKIGHFNGFPMVPNGPVPSKNQTNWVTLVDEIRGLGGKVVILNHPRWRPMDIFNSNALNPVTGERGTGAEITFDAMELVNSAAMIPHKTNVVNDWFALLNHGEEVWGLGASDSHAVGSPVGQARTYLRSSTDEPSKINVDEAVENILKGYMSSSFGIFADVEVNGRYHMGQTAPVKGSKVKVKLRVAAPSWVQPERALFYLNGVVVAERSLVPKHGKPFDENVTISIPTPRHDAHLVCVVFGGAAADPTWKAKDGYTFASTNPVFLDVDRDGKYRSPYETAKFLLTTVKGDLKTQWSTINQADDAVAVQMVDLIYKSATDEEWNELKKRLQGSDRKVFHSLLASYPPAEIPLTAK